MKLLIATCIGIYALCFIAFKFSSKLGYLDTTPVDKEQKQEDN